MENIQIDATERSPEVNFDFDANAYSIKGESYPEDVAEFYGNVVGKLEEHFESLKNEKVNFCFELIYFNSSTAKVLMGLFEAFEALAGNGNQVTVSWICDEDDDNMEEMGEEFGEELEVADFELIKKAV